MRPSLPHWRLWKSHCQPPHALNTVWITGFAAFSSFMRSFAFAPPDSSLM